MITRLSEDDRVLLTNVQPALETCPVCGRRRDHRHYITWEEPWWHYGDGTPVNPELAKLIRLGNTELSGYTNMETRKYYVITYDYIYDGYDSPCVEHEIEEYDTLEAMTKDRYDLINNPRRQILVDTVKCFERTDVSLDSMFMKK